MDANQNKEQKCICVKISNSLNFKELLVLKIWSFKTIWALCLSNKV